MNNIKDQILIRAIHEAGHGMLCHYLGVIPKKLTLDEEQDNGFGRCKVPINDFGFENATLSIDQKVKSLAMVYIAGREAVLKVQPDAIPLLNFDFDYKQAKALLFTLASDEEKKKNLLLNLEDEVREVFNQEDRWCGVERLAEELIKKKNLPWKDAKAIFQQLLLRPRFRIS
jgi:hypothetical protein